jgi:sugar-specific transcriptional regulator TrmB
LIIFFEKRKIESEREMEVLKNSIEETKQALRSVPTQKLKDEVFWTTAITESEIEKLILPIYREVKKSVRAIPFPIILPNISNLLPEILKAIDRGVKIKLLITPHHMTIIPVFIKHGKKTLDKLKKSIEIRIAKNINSSFLVVDDNVVVLLQLHPTDKDRILSIVKILDTGLAKSLGEEYDSLWSRGEQLDFEEFIRKDGSVAKKNPF